MKNGWDQYVTKKRIVAKGYVRKRKNREIPNKRAASVESVETQKVLTTSSELIDLTNELTDLTNQGQEMKNGDKKKVLKHLKEDKKEFREQIKDDTKLAKALKKKSK